MNRMVKMTTSQQSERATFRRLYFYTSTKLHRDRLGRMRSYNPVMSNEEWEPFLRVFDEVIIFARLEKEESTGQGHVLDLPGIKIEAIPYYRGPIEFLKTLRTLRKFLDDRFTDENAYYGMLGLGILGPYIARKVEKLEAPFLVRVIGDPVGVAQSIIPAPFNRAIMALLRKNALATIEKTNALTYVTLTKLQESYPPPSDALVLARTNLQFTDELQAISKKQYDLEQPPSRLSVIAVGSQEQNYKGHDLLLEAFAELQEMYPTISLTLVGTGRLHQELVEQAEYLELKNVTFIERLGTNIDVAKEVVQHDLFIMPSRTEGMPKALLEAMYLGVFCLGSNVGGIPELLEPECVFERGSSAEIVRAISSFVESPRRVLEHIKLQRKKAEEIKDHHSGPVVMEKFLKTWVARDPRETTDSRYTPK